MIDKRVESLVLSYSPHRCLHVTTGRCQENKGSSSPSHQSSGHPSLLLSPTSSLAAIAVDRLHSSSSVGFQPPKPQKPSNREWVQTSLGTDGGLPEDGEWVEVWSPVDEDCSYKGFDEGDEA
ncbi:hypothetical protein V6N11_047347 [Hibiscus sabdariffa]|uniref:Uncharacterized protein n=1 Tax=Hibiscus sabdariffa TaxID=183260 RepID=A0ABR2NJZ0_9ROSI